MITEELGSFGRVATSPRGGVEWLLPSSSEMAALDSKAIGSGIPALDLMERAGRAIFEATRQIVTQGESCLIVCGTGNNGGDGLVAGRLLAEAGYKVSCVVVQAERYSTECFEQIKRASRFVKLFFTPCVPESIVAGVAGAQSIDQVGYQALFLQVSVVIDALLGTGQRNAPRGVVAELAESIGNERLRRSKLKVLSVDIPTGVNCDTGEVYKGCVRADVTVAIELIKRGILQFPAREMCGEIIAAAIGIANEAVGEKAAEFRAVCGSRLPMMTRRDPAVHKGALGRILIVGGSLAMPGAAILSALGALRAGAGLVTRVTRPHWRGPSVPAECMNLVLEGDQQSFVKGDLEAIVDACRGSDVVVVGPGIGVSAGVKELLVPLLAELRRLRKKTVLDADALNLIAAAEMDLRGLDAVITPHPGEAARLLGCDSAAIQNDRFAAVRALGGRYGVVAVLKGAGTLVYSDRRGVVIPRGTPYLATPGSGDVLSGILGTLLHRCKSCFDAGVLGAWIHAVAGERATRAIGGPIVASDIAFSAAGVVGELERL